MLQKRHSKNTCGSRAHFRSSKKHRSLGSFQLFLLLATRLLASNRLDMVSCGFLKHPNIPGGWDLANWQSLHVRWQATKCLRRLAVCNSRARSRGSRRKEEQVILKTNLEGLAPPLQMCFSMVSFLLGCLKRTPTTEHPAWSSISPGNRCVRVINSLSGCPIG